MELWGVTMGAVFVSSNALRERRSFRDVDLPQVRIEVTATGELPGRFLYGHGVLLGAVTR